MRTILLILLNLQLIYGTTFNSTSSVYDRGSNIPTSEYRLGYTTPYGNGFNTNSGRPRQSRRVKGYTADGDSINPSGIAGSPSPMWQADYEYYYWNGNWYRKKENSWGEWRSLLDWGWALWDWRSGSPGTNNPTRYYKDLPAPIGDPTFFVILSLLFFWMTYDIFIKPMIKNDKN